MGPVFRQLYQTPAPYQSGRLAVSSVHTLRYQQSGNATGRPVVHLHGGPGAGMASWRSGLFNPDKYRIIQFDQRGAGQSTPNRGAEALQDNTTQDLIDDIERLRTHLKIDRWVVSGGSWGASLALLYAQQHPQAVDALLLRGVPLLREQDLSWTTNLRVLLSQCWELGGLSEIDPMYPMFGEETTNVFAMLEDRIAAVPELRGAALRQAWNALGVSTNISDYYWQNMAWLKDGQIIDNMHILAAIPGYIVHGRQDLACLVEQAETLHAAWPNSELHLINNAGHSDLEPGITTALLDASDTIAERLGH